MKIIPSILHLSNTIINTQIKENNISKIYRNNLYSYYYLVLLLNIVINYCKKIDN